LNSPTIQFVASISSILDIFLAAKAQLLLEKPSFKQLVATRLVPADGFYEWRREGNRKVPMWITLKNREPFAFPGLWDCWVDRDSVSARAFIIR
jgi:putative SOS response-associated peptidase YedK